MFWAQKVQIFSCRLHWGRHEKIFRLSEVLLFSVKKQRIMGDNLENRGPQDRDRINVNEDYELDYWTKTLGVTREQLRAAVAAAGTEAAKVRAHLGKQ